MQRSTIYAMYWIPPGYTVSRNFKTLIDGYLTNVADDSGKTNSVYSVTTQYGVPYDSTFGGSAVDTNPFPASGCDDAPTCLTETQIASELMSFASSRGWQGDAGSSPANPQNVFAVFLPRNVVSCFDGGTPCSDDYYCAYHTATTTHDGSHTFIWLNLPYDWADDWGCSSGIYPNGDEADAAIDVLSHEYIESLTDPYGTAWWDDSSGDEIADKCDIDYGSSLGSYNGSTYNQLIGTGHYETQLEYSNASHSCYQVGAPTIASFTPGSGAPGDPVEITGTNFFGNVSVSFNGVAATHVSVASPTQVSAVVPTGSTAGPITLSAMQGDVTSPSSFALPPAIAAFSPAKGVAGTPVRISGVNLTSVSEVDFGGVPAAIVGVASNGKSLVAQVPAGATSGPITLVAGSGSVTSTFNFTPLPVITGFGGEPAHVGDVVTVNGTNLAGLTSAAIGKVTLPIVSSGPTSFTATLPDGVASGRVVATTVTGAARSGGMLHVLPTISSIPSDATAGTRVTITGSGLTGASMVTFGGARASFAVVDSQTISATVPSTGLSGPVAVTTAGGTATSASSFTVDPSIKKLTTTTAAGSVVSISGTGLGDVTLVDFGGGVSAVPAKVTATSATVVVPINALSGPVTLHAGGATVTSAVPVTITLSIQSVSPTSAGYGADVTIAGVGLQAVRGVTFNGVAGAITSRTGSTLHVTVPPSGTIAGPIVINVKKVNLTWLQPFSLVP